MNVKLNKGIVVRKIKDLPIVYLIYKYYTEWKLRHRIQKNECSAEQIFSKIYINNAWNNHESRSGPGSELENTKELVNQLPIFLLKHNVNSILDAPCGDFNWMRHVIFNEVVYYGCDIVQELIDRNNKLYSSERISFFKLNIINDKLPSVDLIFVRDCLVHFNDESIFLFLMNLVKSEIKYLLTTNFPLTEHNYDISMGNWRPINLKKKPYNLPDEINILWELSKEGYGQFPDKSLYLWQVDDIRKGLSKKISEVAV